MNRLGAFLWEQLKEEQTKEELTAKILERYDVDSVQAEQDVETFTTQLLDAGILER